jgi:hypothetical protein
LHKKSVDVLNQSIKNRKERAEKEMSASMKNSTDAIKDAAKELRKKYQDLEEKGVALGKSNRYYEVDRGYDKNFYENDTKNYLKIVGAFCIFYTANILHFWGVFELGMRDTENLTLY